MSNAIIGNSGSGKTHLAKSLYVEGDRLVHLDEIFWLSSYGDARRDESEVLECVSDCLGGDRILVEGVYAKLIELFLGSIDTLIWLDLPLLECVNRVKSRELSRIGTLRPGFIDWVESYNSRVDQTSFVAHEAIFEGFSGDKYRLRSVTEVSEYLLYA